jgi:hypothetical protein
VDASGLGQGQRYVGGGVRRPDLAVGQRGHDVLPAAGSDTVKDFEVAEISADKAYLTKSNVELVEEVGATPFILFRSTKCTGSSYGD